MTLLPFRRSIRHRFKHPSWLPTLVLLVLLADDSLGAVAPEAEPRLALEQCVQAQVLLPANRERSVASLYDMCAPLGGALDETVIATLDAVAQPTRSLSPYAEVPRFFSPYKHNYMIAGRMKNADRSPAFSGNNLDVKFELGMRFSLIPDPLSPTGFAPLHFGYSQRSFWDVSEPSAPFHEHNHNPELFWEPDRSHRPAIPSLFNLRNWLFVDRFGIEHESNGRDGERSRSWDRIYLEREFIFSEALSFNLKLWQVVGEGSFNPDITDYLGHAALTTRINLNNKFDIDLKTLIGSNSSRISHQLDVRFPISRWVSSKFFISYYVGYGEALINYNQRSKSLRTGFYFPL